ncbi:MAG: ATP-binding cassette domain-containing protein [Actinomycetota bacterium]
MNAGTSSAYAFEGAAVALGGQTVWSQADLSVPIGDFAALIGPNGAGKTTMLRVLLGQIPLSAGSCTVFGDPPRRGNPAIGYVPQHYDEMDTDSIRAIDVVQLALGGERWGPRRSSSEDDDRAYAALERVGAAHVARRRLSQVSGGEQQRVAIAQALVSEPDLLFLDEPLANLDITSSHDIVELLRSLATDRQLSMLVVVHDLDPLVAILDGAVHILDGRPHYDPLETVLDSDLLTRLYRAPVEVIRTADGDVFTKGR